MRWRLHVSELELRQEHNKETTVSKRRVRVLQTRKLVIRNLDFKDRVFLQERLSKQDLLYGLFYGLLCFPVFISFKSICIFFESKNSLCLVFALFLWLLVKLSLESNVGTEIRTIDFRLN